MRNGAKLYYPVVQAIKSILPICDEVFVAIGRGDFDDTTREDIMAMGDPKIIVIDTEWEEQYFQRGIINALQTDIALYACRGDWCFYIQADEVVHEKYLPVIRNRCQELIDDPEVEGLLFRYKHFWGDYWHYHTGHGWYPHEIRIIRNLPQIHSWESAQSFRYFEKYNHPRQRKDSRKLRVAKVDAEIYHYGWVRPPHLMQKKNKAFKTIHWGQQHADEFYDTSPREFDYGPLDKVDSFSEAHPAVMKSRIAEFNWEDKLEYSGKPNLFRKKHKHEKAKYRFLSLVESWFNIQNPPWAFKNYVLLEHK